MSEAAAVFHHADAGTSEADWSGRPEWARVPAMTVTHGDYARLVLVAAHPDDETLGAGGLLATAAAAGLQVDILLLTAGEASHPRSATHSRADLAALRLDETRAACALLAPGARLLTAGLPDGELDSREDDVVEAIVRLIGEEGATTLLAAPWRADRHSDHETAGRAAAVAAHRTDARLVEYPIWLWHWAAPEDAPWQRFRALPLDGTVRARKSHAISLHRSQVAPLSDHPGDETLLHPGMLKHFVRDRETFIDEPPTADVAFDRVHTETADPWSVDDSWYEERKSNLTLAALPRRRFRRALEVGCSIGALTARLAGRCDEVVALDESAAAVAAAARRLAQTANVQVGRADLPEEWPDGSFDLVVVSEVGYFLSPHRLRSLIDRAEGSLSDDGVIVLCHWRHEIVGWPLDGPRVHEIWLDATRLAVVAQHVEADFLLDVLSDVSDHRQRPS